MRMSTMQKVHWLQQNYKNYSTEWYLSDLLRLEAMFKAEYSIHSRNISNNMSGIIREKMNEKVTMAERKYKEKYGSDLNDDLKINRRMVIERMRDL